MEMSEGKRPGVHVRTGRDNYGLIPGNGRGCMHAGARNDGCGRRQLIIQHLSTADNNYRTLSGTCQHVVIGKGHAMRQLFSGQPARRRAGRRSCTLVRSPRRGTFCRASTTPRTFLPRLLITYLLIYLENNSQFHMQYKELRRKKNNENCETPRQYTNS